MEEGPSATEVAWKENGLPFSEDWDDIEEDTRKVKDYLSEWPKSRVEALTQTLKTAPWHEHKYKLKTYSQIMTGQEIADWLKEMNFAKMDVECESIGQAMVDRHMIYHLKKKREAEGFKVHDKFWFSPTPITHEEFGTLFGRLISEKEKKGEVGVIYRKDGNLVLAVIEERQRRGEPQDGAGRIAFTQDALKEGKDPAPMSCQMGEVPLPAVLDATPDLCEWMNDWAVEEAEGTDSAGWMYAKDFNAEKWDKAEADIHQVRKRNWVRHARKKPEKKSKKDEEEAEEKPKDENRIGEDSETMLANMANATTRQPRAGFMEITAHRGEGLWRRCDSFIIVECRDSKDKSSVCKKEKDHAWGHKSFINMKSDLDPITITVFQNNTGKKKTCLGKAEFFVPEDEVGGSRTIRLKPADDDKTAQLAGFGASELGAIAIEWTFAVDGEATAIAVANAGAVQLSRCVLTLHCQTATGLSIDKKRIGPCGFGVGAVRGAKVYLRAVYKGELCEMIAESKRVSMKSETNFDWKISLDTVPTAPVQLELWAEGLMSGLARLTFEYKDTDHGEHDEELLFRGPDARSMMIAANDTSESAITSAGGHFGKLKCHWQWEPMKSSFQELVEAQESTLDPEGGNNNLTSNLMVGW